MSIRRSGMAEAPGVIASVRNPGVGVADVSPMWRALGREAAAIQERLQPAADAFAEAQARQDFAAGRQHLRSVWLEEDNAYNNAMEQLYGVQASLEIDTLVDTLEMEHPIDGDMGAFDNAIRAARTEFIRKGNPQFAQQAGALFDRAHLSARERIGQRRRNHAIEQLQQSGLARMAQMEAQLSGFTDLQSDEFRQRWSEYEATGDALSANPLSGFYADEWTLRRDNTLSRLTANAMQYTAEQIYEDGGANADSAEAALAVLERGMNDPNLTLDEGQRDAFFGEGRRRIMARERERLAMIREVRANLRAARAEAREETRDTIAEFQARAQAFAVIPDQEMNELRQSVEASQSGALARQFNELVIENNYRRSVQGASIAQVEQFNDALQARVTANGEDAADAAIALRAGRAYVEHIRRGDPLIVAQQHLGEAPPPIIGEEGLEVSNIGPRIRFAEAAAGELGAAQPSYFSAGEREAFAGQVRAGGEEGLAAVRAIVSSAFAEEGDGFTRAQRMLSEVATRGDDALLAAGTVMLLGGESASGTARLIMEAQRLRQIDGYVKPQLPGQNEGDQRENRINAYLGANGAFLAPEMRAQLRRSADLVFEGMVAGGGEANATTYDAAVRAALGSVTRDVNGSRERFGGVAAVRGQERVVIPNWIRNNQFRTIRETLTARDYAFAGGGRVPRTGTRRDWRNAYLIWTGEPGRYYLADEPDGQRHYEVAPGEPYVLDFNLIRGELSARRPDAVVR